MLRPFYKTTIQSSRSLTQITIRLVIRIDSTKNEDNVRGTRSSLIRSARLHAIYYERTILFLIGRNQK